jgi:Fic family protein
MPFVHQPPDMRKILGALDSFQKVMAKVGLPETQSLFVKANEEYLHWDSFRHQSMPAGMSHEEAWALVKLSRTTQFKSVPFADKQGRPFSYWIPDHLLKQLNEIDRWSGGMILTDQPGGLPGREQYVISSLMEEAIASSQLEGAATTRKVAKEMLRTGRKPKDVSEQMILNNWETIQFIRSHRAEPLTTDRLCEIQRIVTLNTLKDPTEAGQLRTKDDIVVVYNDETVHVPPAHHSLADRMKAFCDFANRDEPGGWIHPVIKGAMLHFWLAYDHPFTDGNGRTARAIMYWYLLSRNYLLFEYLAISRYIIRAPAKYVRAYLYTETDEGDLTYFLAYNLAAIEQAIEDVRAYLRRKQQELAHSQVLLRTYRGLNARQKNLLYHALRHPEAVFTIETHRSYHQIVYETARRDLLQLAAKGLLKQEKQGREFVFVPNERMLDKLRERSERSAKT